MSSPRGKELRGREQHSPALDATVKQRLREELAVLRAQRDQLRGDSAQDHRAADSGDRAEALRRADDVFRIEDRIREITHLLTAGPATRAGSLDSGALSEGSTVTLRFPDGAEETFYASKILDTAPAYMRVELLGLNSPLAKALAGCSAGDTIRWRTPAGAQQAHVVTIQPHPPTGHRRPGPPR
jgi:transcription elongation GreA/GreB family factor